MAQMKHAKKKIKLKKGYGFRRFMFVWILLLIIISAIAIVTVNKTLREMQSSSAEQVIADSLSRMSDDQIKQYFEFNSEYEGSDAVKNVKEFFSSKAYTIKQDRSTGIYNIYNGGRVVLGVELEKVRTVNKYLIFNYNVMKLKSVIPTESKELFHYEISAASDHQITVNGKAATPTKKDVPKGFLDAADYVSAPSGDRYILDHLSKQPELVITKNGQKVDFTLSEEIILDTEFKKFDTLEAAGCDFDAMEFAHTWSLFMSADYGNKDTYWGFYDKIAPYLIEGSEQYKKALQWGSAIDAQFTWGHTFKNPPFTEESLTNVTKYSDDIYSVDVHFVKHMVLSANGDEIDDPMDSTIYIIRYNGEWKVVNVGGIDEIK